MIFLVDTNVFGYKNNEELINMKIYLVTYVVSSCHVRVNISSRT